MRLVKIVSRSSALAVAQAEIVRNRLQAIAPDYLFEIVTTTTKGDADVSKPLYELQGRDFFSKDIDEFLMNGNAHIAVHSLKDLSAERMHSGVFLSAVVERQNPRDVVVFNPNTIAKIKEETILKIGTSSLRRQTQALEILSDLLPTVQGKKARCTALPIRGNVDNRLQQLHDGKFDGIILAAAGLNRLLNAGHAKTKQLLIGKKMFWLPLVECAPAPGQGALIAECLPQNNLAVELLHKINNATLEKQLNAERNAVLHLGGGCHQRYGAIALETKHVSWIFISGKDSNGNDVSNTLFQLPTHLNVQTVVDASDFLKNTIQYTETFEPLKLNTKAVFIAHKHAVREGDIALLQQKNVWCSGINTWKHLAQKGIWCCGCADGLGVEFLLPILNEPLAFEQHHLVTIITNEQSAAEWQNHAFNAVGTYNFSFSLQENQLKELAKAQAIFWHNFSHYDAVKHLLNQETIHLCASGKTADKFLAQGLKPIIFPTIQSFKQWKKNSQ